MSDNNSFYLALVASANKTKTSPVSGKLIFEKRTSGEVLNSPEYPKENWKGYSLVQKVVVMDGKIRFHGTAEGNRGSRYGVRFQDFTIAEIEKIVGEARKHLSPMPLVETLFVPTIPLPDPEIEIVPTPDATPLPEPISFEQLVEAANLPDDSMKEAS